MTTDNMNEVFDVVDINDNVVGKSSRGEAHKNKNLIHRSVGVVVINGDGKIFLQRRSSTKDKDALLWTISCSGHVLSGESYTDAAIRELEEELGITGVTLMKLTKFLYKGLDETEIATLYKIDYSGEIKLQTEEILEGKFFNVNELNVAVKTKEIELSLYGKISLEKLGFLYES